MKTPLGIDDAHPGLSWKIRDARRGVAQTARRILVASSPEILAQGQGDLWDSGEIASDCSHLLAYEGKPLASRQRCFWKVQVKTRAADGGQAPAVWSQPSWWEMGLLKPEDWRGNWIESPACRPVENETTRLWARQALIPQELNQPAVMKNKPLAEAVRIEGERLMGSVLPAPVFRTTFEVPGKIRRARLYISGLGFQEAFVNGAAVSDRLHDPSVTDYQGRGGYVTHDITSLVHGGGNVITAIVGGGWWNESMIWGSPETVMGRPSLRAQIEVELAGGRRIVIPTRGQWTMAAGPILKSHYYAGEVYDARRAPGWASGKDDGLGWAAATEVKAPVSVLAAQRCEPERAIRRVKPVAVKQPRPGIWVFDLGELIVGTVELRLKAPAGTTLVLRTAEWTWNPEQQGENFKTSLLHYDQGDNRVRTPGMIVGKPRGSTYFSFNFQAKAHYHGHHAAGHITHQLLYDVYSDHGLIETCYDMMNATSFPSFAWQLQSGNRTIPEGPSWKDFLPAKASAYQNECQEPARWFTQTLCGVAPDRAEPGFKHVLLRPRIPSRLPSAQLATTTPYGELESRWSQESGVVTWTVRIPANSHATAWIPAPRADLVQESGRPLGAAPGCNVQGQGVDGVECHLGSGAYQFRFPAPANAPSRLSELK